MYSHFLKLIFTVWSILPHDRLLLYTCCTNLQIDTCPAVSPTIAVRPTIVRPWFSLLYIDFKVLGGNLSNVQNSRVVPKIRRFRDANEKQPSDSLIRIRAKGYDGLRAMKKNGNKKIKRRSKDNYRSRSTKVTRKFNTEGFPGWRWNYSLRTRHLLPVGSLVKETTRACTFVNMT